MKKIIAMLIVCLSPMYTWSEKITINTNYELLDLMLTAVEWGYPYPGEYEAMQDFIELAKSVSSESNWSEPITIRSYDYSIFDMAENMTELYFTVMEYVDGTPLGLTIRRLDLTRHEMLVRFALGLAVYGWQISEE